MTRFRIDQNFFTIWKPSHTCLLKTVFADHPSQRHSKSHHTNNDWQFLLLLVVILLHIQIINTCFKRTEKSFVSEYHDKDFAINSPIVT